MRTSPLAGADARSRATTRPASTVSRKPKTHPFGVSASEAKNARLDTLKDGRDPLTEANTHGRETELSVLLIEDVRERAGDTRARAT